ncbi:MAG: hypothetical protein NT062_31510 [Proteobacteria bacterium]|nr:hypothetical protein [Pseudomonadota bacterium]
MPHALVGRSSDAPVAAAVRQHLVRDDRLVGGDVEALAQAGARELRLRADRRGHRARDVLVGEADRRVREEQDRDLAGLEALQRVVRAVGQRLALALGQLGELPEVDRGAAELDVDVDRVLRRVGDEHREARVERRPLRRVHVDRVVVTADGRVVLLGREARVHARAVRAQLIERARGRATLAVDHRRVVRRAARAHVGASGIGAARRAVVALAVGGTTGCHRADRERGQAHRHRHPLGHRGGHYMMILRFIVWNSSSEIL